MATLNLARTLPRSRANGPGERFVIWAQGCTLRCPGCWNPDTWAKRERSLWGVDELAEVILRTSGIEGVSFTGGEPFEQAEAFAELATIVRARGLSVMAFTGYELDELGTPGQSRLLALCDLVVAGRYLQAQRLVGEPWRGSSNQVVHLRTDRYAGGAPAEVACEYHLFDDGELVLTGFPADELRDPEG